MNNWLIVVITLILSAFFSGMEIAFVTSNNLKIEIDKSKGLLPARIISFFNTNPSRFIGALLLGNNIALVLYGVAMANILEPAIRSFLPQNIYSEFPLLIIQTILATLLILFTAEFLPKTLFRINPNKILNIFAIPVLIFYILFYPVIWIFTILGELILILFFRQKPSDNPYVFSTIDLDNYVKEFTGDTTDENENIQEIQMFQNAIEFRDIKIRECMVPRTDIEAIEEHDTIENLRKRFIDTGFSKIPVFHESIDDIIGYTHHSDLFRNPENIVSIMRHIFYVPETMLAKNVLSMFIQQHKSIAIVVDEFGGTSGLVTMEDIIEEIFGEIEDEYDEEDLIEKKLGNGEYIFSGRLEIDYLNEKYSLGLPESEDYETLAGLILQHYESIPDPNEKIAINNMIFTIMHSTSNRIDQVHLKLTE